MNEFSAVDPVAMIARSLVIFLNFYFVLLLVRVLLTWFPTVDWSNPIFATISQLTDPYLNLFRSIIPPLGGIDFSPMLAILLLQVLTQALAPLGVA
ncbi:YggT family protein [Microcoleus sp. FACHB-1515]|uniref:YggT family protein n=1 Tax=Cyanophyceae TaxID=3028117 RepID=UPI00168209BE|nr:YggT family protein [Microcoleus sp. FACHB-1515]MBD2093096.1 YggT family protein [Microcoleus sp. FACHB-1515]